MKDYKAFKSKSGVCYVPELSNQKYTYTDFLDLAQGNKKLAQQLFSVVEWQHPETIIDEWEIEDEYKTCDNCSYDIIDDKGDIMEHYCTNDQIK